ncbi:MAG: M56 family metallopeptidase [Bacteroidota bacterium]
MFVYLIESAIGFSIIYSFYKYVFFQSTHFEWNRFYFYFAIIISLIIPLIPFPLYTNISSFFNQSSYMTNPMDGTGLLVYTENKSFLSNWFNYLNSKTYLNIKNLLYIIYFSGVIRFLVVLVKNNLDIIRLLKKAEVYKEKKYTIAQLPYDETAFSYFNYIFLGKKYKLLNNNEQEKVLVHEKIHAAQKHSLDILIYEIYEMVFWFNPYVRKAKKTLKDLHEYIVDTEITTLENPYQYSNLLIKLSTNNIRTKLANLFSRNPLKDRIKLLAFPESIKLKKFRFIIGFPVLLLILLSYSFMVSEINHTTNNLQFVDKNSFVEPVSYGSQLIGGFFIKKELQQEKNYNILISHPEISYSTESFTKIIATKDGEVIEIKELDNWGLIEYEITIKHDKKFTSKYKGIWKSRIQLNEKVEREQVIGISGDKRLYPAFSYQLLLKGKPVDPFAYIE